MRHTYIINLTGNLDYRGDQLVQPNQSQNDSICKYQKFEQQGDISSNMIELNAHGLAGLASKIAHEKLKNECNIPTYNDTIKHAVEIDKKLASPNIANKFVDMYALIDCPLYMVEHVSKSLRQYNIIPMFTLKKDGLINKDAIFGNR